MGRVTVNKNQAAVVVVAVVAVAGLIIYSTTKKQPSPLSIAPATAAPLASDSIDYDKAKAGGYPGTADEWNKLTATEQKSFWDNRFK